MWFHLTLDNTGGTKVNVCLTHVTVNETEGKSSLKVKKLFKLYVFSDHVRDVVPFCLPDLKTDTPSENVKENT